MQHLHSGLALRAKPTVGHFIFWKSLRRYLKKKIPAVVEGLLVFTLGRGIAERGASRASKRY